MSGTSVDAIDVACADLWLAGPELGCRYRGLVSVPFSAGLREAITAALPPASPGAGLYCRLHAELGAAYAAAFARARAELADSTADLAVLHGQTVYHWVDPDGRARGTLQLGDPSPTAERLGIPVISSLRGPDIAAGGQGAPLVALFDQLLLAGRARPAAAVNLGGIANMTVVSGGRLVAAYDVGPAGALMDPAGERASDGAQRFDRDGAAAARGRVCPPLLARLKADDYYQRRWPKSTGREHFNAAYLETMLSGLDPAPGPDDVAATVTRLLVDLLCEAADRHRLAEVVLSGGGSRNRTTLAWLRAGLPGTAVRPSDDLGVPAQAKEALAFAVLGFLTWNGLPGSVPEATGAAHASILGAITPGTRPLLLPAPARTVPAALRVLSLARR
jgi:anhydro-N-acetylmuramic acid kinase